MSTKNSRLIEVKCRYAHCKHEDKTLSRDEAIKVGSAYYHKDCHDEIKKIKEIKQYYIDHFESDPIMAYLQRVIHDIVYNKNISPHFLLFALQYANDNHLRLNHPPGMYYLVKRDDINNAWQKKNQAKISDSDFIVADDLTPVDGYSQQSRSSGFSKILGAK